MSKPLHIVWQAMLGGWTGLSFHAEAMAHQMHLDGAHVMLRPVDHPFAGPAHSATLRRLTARAIDPGAPQISYVPPEYWDTHHPGYKIGFTMLEVTGIPGDWVRCCNAMDEIFVPSEFNRRTFAQSGVRKPITVVPLGIDPALFCPDGPSYEIGDYFTFLSVFEWGERKAPEVLLRAFTQEFSANERVVLLIKANNHDPDVDVAEQVQAMDLRDGAAPVIFLFNQPLSEAQMPALYRSADCFVLPTRGEGWGMPLLEAMACGLPVIATNWSAHTEFMNTGNAYPLRVRNLIPAQAKCPYYKGFKWADPDTEHLQHLMRHVYQHRQEAQAKGQAASLEVLSQWTWRHTAEKIAARLLDIEMKGKET